MHEDATGIKFIVRIRGIVKTNLKVMPSRARRDINKWFCCIIKVVSIIAGIN